MFVHHSRTFACWNIEPCLPCNSHSGSRCLELLCICCQSEASPEHFSQIQLSRIHDTIPLFWGSHRFTSVYRSMILLTVFICPSLQQYYCSGVIFIQFKWPELLWYLVTLVIQYCNILFMLIPDICFSWNNLPEVGLVHGKWVGCLLRCDSECLFCYRGKRG